MRVRIVSLRLAVTVALCYLSFYLFTQTPAYLALGTLAARFLPGVELATVMLVLLSALVIPACVLGGKRSMRFIYIVSIALYLPSAISVSGINWAAILGVPVEVGAHLPGIAMLVGLAIIGGYLWLLCTSRIEREYVELIERGGAKVEVGAVASGQLTLAVALTLASFLAALSAFAIAALPWSKLLPTGLPSPHVLLGACGVVLILACVSFYLLAARGTRPTKKPETK